MSHQKSFEDLSLIVECPYCKSPHNIVAFHAEDIFECPKTKEPFGITPKATNYARSLPKEQFESSIKDESGLLPILSKNRKPESEVEKTPSISNLNNQDIKIEGAPTELKEEALNPSTENMLGGKYELRKVLGGGGFGIVYKGYDTVLRRHVAVKKSNNPLEDDRIELFQKEAEILAQVNHPNIVQVYDFNIDEEQIPYIVIEFISGDHIGSYVRKLRKEKKKEEFILTVCKFFSELADALAFLHEKKIYHQDLKPKNILVCEETGRVKLLDFGLAIIGEQEISHFEGTCRYCAPERFETGYKPTITSDIYSLGIVLFQSLTGRVGIPGDTIPQIIGNIIAGRTEIEFKKEEVPEALKKICIKATHPNPKHRYQHASELHFDLSSYIDDVTKVSDYPYLYLLEREQQGRILFPLMQNKYYIGRSFGNDLVIQDETISRVHGLIRINEARVTLTNISKTSPIQVNEQILNYNQTASLSQNDIIKISDYIFFYVPSKKREELSLQLEEEPSLISLEQAKLLLLSDEDKIQSLIDKGYLRTIPDEEGTVSIDSSSLHQYIEKTSGNKLYLNAETPPQVVQMILNSEEDLQFERIYEFESTQETITIGRSPDCSVVIESSEISRLHCRIERQNSGDFLLVDMGSSNGTFIGRERVKKQILVDGDELTLVKFRIKFKLTTPTTGNNLQDSTNPLLVAQMPEEGKSTLFGMEGRATLFGNEAPIPTRKLTRTQTPELDAYLSFNSESGNPEEIPIENTITLFGADATCDYSLHGTAIEPKHAMIIREETGFRLVNLKSNIGVILNDRAVSNASLLFNGDRFRIANYEYKFNIGSPKTKTS